MTDRELLELAAKAAGYQIDQRASFMTWRDSRKLALLNPQGGHTLWNAEDDDGDALRLAAKLYLWEAVRLAHREVSADIDIYATTRRSITRAAASIGESK
jgi:hypothetical protein